MNRLLGVFVPLAVPPYLPELRFSGGVLELAFPVIPPQLLVYPLEMPLEFRGYLLSALWTLRRVRLHQPVVLLPIRIRRVLVPVTLLPH